MNVILGRCSKAVVLASAFVLGPGCASVKPGPDFRRVRELVEESTGFPDTFNPEDPALTGEEIASALADGLSIDEAVRLALLNNRRLQAEFMSIGVAKADWVQSGLLSNPSLDMLLRFPLDGGRSQIEGFFIQNILELWRIPLRKEITQHELDDTVFAIARIASDLVADTRNAYYEALAADELRALAQENRENARRAYEAVRSLGEAGAASRFDESLSRGPFLDAEVTVLTRQLEARAARRRLADLLSTDLDVDEVVLLGSLPEPLGAELDVESLIALALEVRLDLRAYRAAVEAASVQISFERRKALGELSAGVAVERPPVAGDSLVGPTLTAEIPIFDQNQAQVARAEYLYLQALRSVEALERRIAQQIRGTADRAMTAASTVTLYLEEVLPQAEQNLAFATTAYTSGQASLIEMLEAQRTFLEVRTSYIETRRHAAEAVADLVQVVGRPLDQLGSIE